MVGRRVNLAAPDGRISRMTTRAVQKLFARVYRIIDDVADASESHGSGVGEFRVVVGSRSEEITDQIANSCQDVAMRSHARLSKNITIVSQFISHCEAIHESLGPENRNASIATIEDALMAAPEIWNSNTIVVLPRAEALVDGDLAHLIVAAREADAHLVLGYDVSKVDGVAERRLATWRRTIDARCCLRRDQSNGRTCSYRKQTAGCRPYTISGYTSLVKSDEWSTKAIAAGVFQRGSCFRHTREC